MSKIKNNNNKSVSFRGKNLLLIVLLCYALLFVIDFQLASDALQKAAGVLAKILPIFAFVILFTAILNYFLRPKQIAKYLGEEAGLKGWFWSLAGGVISHGPMYAWFPLLEDLRKHGMRDALIVVFFYSRAIKLPILPIMIDYFGWLFTLVLSIYILLGAILQGWILDFLKEN